MKKLLFFLFKLALLSLILGFAHHWLLASLRLPAPEILPHLPRIYIFLFLLNAISYAIFMGCCRWAFSKAGFAFLALSLLKMGLSVVYLWPHIQNPKLQNEKVVVHFMIPYLLLLFFEAFQAQKLLKRN